MAPATSLTPLFLIASASILVSCTGVAFDPFTSAPCEVDLDCPSEYACQATNATGARSCQPLTPYDPIVDVPGTDDPDGGGGDGDGGGQTPTVPQYCREVKTVLAKVCNGCHNDNPVGSGVFTMRFDVYADTGGVMGAKSAATRIKVRGYDFKDMPPKSYATQPSDAERLILFEWFKGGAPDCEPVTPPTTTPPVVEAVKFSTQIQPILTQRCASCHGNGSIQGNVDLRPAAAYASLVGPSSGCNAGTKLVVPNNTANSMLWRKLSNDPSRCLSTMPPASALTTLDNASFKLIEAWISQGAANN